MKKPICPFIPTSNLIIKRSQTTLDLVSKDVEKVVFQKMRKSMESGQVQYLTFTFCVLSKVRVYENLKNGFRETMGNQTRHKESDTVENRSKVSLILSSKNVKNAFFESMTSHKNESGITSLAFTFTTLSIEPVDELEANFQGRSRASEKNSFPHSLATHPTGVILNPLYELVEDPIYEEVDFQKVSKENNPPPLPSMATHPAKRAVSNPLHGLVTKRKNSLGKIREFFNKYFPRRSFSIPQARYTPFAFDSGFVFNAESENIYHSGDHIYEEVNSGERKLSEDSGYETIPSPKESIKSVFSDSGYEVPRKVEPVVYLEVLP